MPDARPVQCPRCGFYPIQEVDICWACPDGVASAARARRLVDAAVSEVEGASRVLKEVRDRRALHVILESLAGGVGGRVRQALVSAAGRSGGDDEATVEALISELWNTDVNIAREAVDALADATAKPGEATDSLAAAMNTRPQLELSAALVLAWRHDQRGLPALERELSRGRAGEHNLNRAPGPMLGRLGSPGRDALIRLLSGAITAQPDPPRPWSGPDRVVRELIDGLIGRYGEPNLVGLAAARQAVVSCAWAATRLEEALAQLEGRALPHREPPVMIDSAQRVVPRWAMRLRRVANAQRAPITRFGGQPYFPDEPAWPLHPANGLPLTFLCQIAVPESIAGDGTWLVHVFVDVGHGDSVDDPEHGFPVPAWSVIAHPSGRWWGPTARRKTGPMYAYEWPDEWPSADPLEDRFRPGPAVGSLSLRST